MGIRCIICDIDGTIANDEHRQHYLQNTPRDWTGYFNAMNDDKPISYTIRLLSILGEGDDQIILATGRPETHREITHDWMELHKVGYDLMLMRKEHDFRPDYIIKKEMLEYLRAHDYEPWLAIEDRPEVVTMWRDNNIPCLVTYNSFLFWYKYQRNGETK